MAPCELVVFYYLNASSAMMPRARKKKRGKTKY